METIKEKFIKVYDPLLKKFKDEIKDINLEFDPPFSEPVIPIFGENYEYSKYKIAIFGIDSKGWGNISKFVNKCTTKLYDENNNYINSLDYLNDVNNKGFWDFIFKFFAKLYSIGDWNLLRKNENNEFDNIHKSFVWGNLNAIELYKTVQKRKININKEDWCKIKEASKIFDKGSIILDVYKPKIILILNWKEDASDKWLTEGLTEGMEYSEELLSEKLCYYFIKNTNTHVYWTAHPVRMKYIPLDPDKIIDIILQSIKSKKVA